MLNTDPLTPARRRVLDIVAANPGLTIDRDVIVLDEDGVRSFLPLADAVAAEHARPCVIGDDPRAWSGWLFGDGVAWLDAVPVTDDERPVTLAVREVRPDGTLDPVVLHWPADVDPDAPAASADELLSCWLDWANDDEPGRFAVRRSDDGAGWVVTDTTTGIETCRIDAVPEDDGPSWLAWDDDDTPEDWTGDDDDPWQCDGCGAWTTDAPGSVWHRSDETLLLCRTCAA